MRTYNYIISLVSIGISVLVYFTAEYTMTGIMSGQYDIGPSVFPKGIAVVSIILSVILVIQTYRGKFSKLKLSEVFGKRETISVSIAIGLFIVYFTMVSFLGFILATLLFILSFTRFLGIKSIKGCAILSVVASYTVYYIFQEILSVQLPTGIWG